LLYVKLPEEEKNRLFKEVNMINELLIILGDS
jgi:hypothetical protein